MSYETKLVAEAAAFLDGQVPGWERTIDLGTLNIGSGWNCILGQIAASMSDEKQASLGGHREMHNALDIYYVGLECVTSGWSFLSAVWNLDGGKLEHMSYAFCGEFQKEIAWTNLIKTRFDTGALSDAA